MENIMAKFKLCSLLIIITSVAISFIYCLQYFNTTNVKPLILTKFIEDNNIDLAKNLCIVQHQNIHVTNYAGYFTVNRKYNSNMFFWFFPAQNNSQNAPLILWLQGGPGASSLYGLFTENGPFFINSNMNFESRKESWHLNHNLLYIDNPIGAGFSFTDDEAGYSQNQLEVGENLLNAMKQFLTLFPEFKTNDFYITGESYAGKYIPALGVLILKNNRESENKINLQGVVIGSGLIDPVNQINYGEHLYHLGLIDKNGYRLFNDYRENITDCINEKKQSSVFTNLTGLNSIYNILDEESEAPEQTVDYLLKYTDFKQSIHVGNIVFNKEVTTVQTKLTNDIMDSVSEWFAELLGNCKVFLYNGQFDIIVSYMLTQNFLNNFNFSAADEYKVAIRHIWTVENEVAGYFKRAGNLTEILIRKAGHFASRDQPKWALNMLTEITYGNAFNV